LSAKLKKERWDDGYSLQTDLFEYQEIPSLKNRLWPLIDK